MRSSSTDATVRGARVRLAVVGVLLLLGLAAPLVARTSAVMTDVRTVDMTVVVGVPTGTPAPTPPVVPPDAPADGAPAGSAGA